MVYTLLAQIVNRALPGAVQNASSPQAAANVLGKYIAVLWRTSLILGGLGVIIFLLMGGFYWITAGGEKGKIEQAKERIMQAIIGFAVLSSIGAVSVFLSQAFGVDLLKPDFGTLSSGTGGSGGSGSGSGGGDGSGAIVCPTKSGGLRLGETGTDGGNNYCTSGGVARMKCVEPGEGPSGFDYYHLEPCECLGGTSPLPGYTFTSC